MYRPSYSYHSGPSGYNHRPSGYKPRPSGYNPRPSGYYPRPSGYYPGPSGYYPNPPGYYPGPSGYYPHSEGTSIEGSLRDYETENRDDRVQQGEKVDPLITVNAPSTSGFSMATTVTDSLAVNPAASVGTTQSVIPPDYNETIRKFWSKAKKTVLMNVYKRYKVKFPGGIEQAEWIKLAQEVRKKAHVQCNELECRTMLDVLKCEYEKKKGEPMKSRKMKKQLAIKKRVFEMTENQVKKPRRNWSNAQAYMLIEVYTKYKAEFSCPGANEQIIWKKIHDEFREKSSLHCSELDCRNVIGELKGEYESLNKNPIMKRRKMVKFLDKAREVFERSENPDEFCDNESNDKALKSSGKKNKSYHFALLKAYASNKTEFDSPGIKELEVWEKIAKEVRDIYSFKCGASQCRQELLLMKKQYYDFRKNQKAGGMPYFLDEARLAFETDGNLAKTFTVKVENLMRNITVHDLHELFNQFGPIDGIYTTTTTYGPVKGVGYISFCQEEDAYKAISAVHGSNYNNLILSVSWLKDA